MTINEKAVKASHKGIVKALRQGGFLKEPHFYFMRQATLCDALGRRLREVRISTLQEMRELGILNGQWKLP